MAIVGTHLTDGNSLASGTSYTTASISPTSGSPVFIAIDIKNGASTDPTVSSVSGCGLTWTDVGSSSPWDSTSGSRRQLHVWKGLGTPSSGTITITTGETDSTCSWSVDEFSGVDTTSPVVQSNHNENGDVGSSVTVTLSAFSSASNGTYGGFGHWNNVTMSADGGHTVLVTQGTYDPGIAVEYNPGNDTSVVGSFSGAANIGGVAIELAAATAGGSTPATGYMTANTGFWGQS